MMSTGPISRADLLASLPPQWPEDVLPLIRAEARSLGRTVIVLDDDPTGTQTVANVPVITEWTTDALAAALDHSPEAFYVLTNSRALPEAEAVALAQSLAGNLATALVRIGRDADIISRSDSTLRGHFPAETQALKVTLTEQAGWQWNGTVLAPFFAEGGRVTVGDTHWIEAGDHFTPVHETDFAHDPVFGYHTAWLPGWVAQKSHGALPPEAVHALSLNVLRTGGPQAASQALRRLTCDSVLLVNAFTNRDIETFVLGTLQAEADGARFLYRTAASFVRARLGQTTQPLLAASQVVGAGRNGGLIVVGSYVALTTRQLEKLRANEAIEFVEISIPAVLDPTRRSAALGAAIELVNSRLAEGHDTVIYTSRAVASNGKEAGQQIAAALVAIVRGLAVRPRYLIAKGGITSSTIATEGLGIRRARVLGQILPGVPVWQAGPESRFLGLSYVVFPGNVGNDDALAQLVARLQAASSVSE